MDYKILFLSILCLCYIREIHSLDNPDNGSSLRVSVAQRAFGGGQFLKLGKENEHLTVMLENISDHDFKLWGGLANRGYANIKVRLTDDSGVTSEASRVIWVGSEIGDTGELFKPGDKRIVEIYPGSEDWQGFPSPPGKPKKYSVKIIYEATLPANDPLSWKGRIESPEQSIWLY